MRIISYANLTSPSTIHSSFIPHSPWESSGEIATDEAQTQIPPVTATETSTGALEGAQVETILKTTPATTVSCNLLMFFCFFCWYSTHLMFCSHLVSSSLNNINSQTMSPILQKALEDLANPTQPATTTVSSIIDEQNPTTQAPTTVSESCNTDCFNI